MVLCYQNCSDLLWEKKCSSDQDQGLEFANFLRSLEQFIQTVKGQNNVFLTEYLILTCSWRFLRSNRLEQLEFKLERKNWDLETDGKS
jgi:hypothetical protein